MNYVLAAAIAAMWGYILVLTLRLRHERVRTQRQQTRGKFAFRPRDRARFLLTRSFKSVPEKADWEDQLVGRLRQVPPHSDRAA